MADSCEGFNEPDLAGQAETSADTALSLWPKLQATGLRLGAPAVAAGADTAGGWLDEFMTGAAARGYRVDFIPLHSGRRRVPGGELGNAPSAGPFQR